MTTDGRHRAEGSIAPERRKVLAFREVGCAVAWLACGFAIDDIADIPDHVNPDFSRESGLRSTVCLPCLAYIPDFLAMVGQCAMDRFDPGFLSHREDAYVVPWRDDESDNAEWLSVQAEASRLVATRWDQISLLAGMLLERGSLTCDEAIATMRSVLVAAEPSSERPQ